MTHLVDDKGYTTLRPASSIKSPIAGLCFVYGLNLYVHRSGNELSVFDYKVDGAIVCGQCRVSSSFINGRE